MSDRPLVSGDKLGPYVLRKKLGEGAMGMVWLAVDPKTRRDVAVKLLLPEFSKDAKMVQRFLREAQSAAKLNHPNTVAIHQVGESAGSVFIIMEWVDGGNLQDILETQRTMPWPDATRAIRQAALGLAAAHAIGLIHRDIKPSNLMRTASGDIKVVDFGLARQFDNRTNITRAGAVVGTPSYMSPEQCSGKDLDARSDIYSLICTYYHLLTGDTPFGFIDLADVLYKQRNAPFPKARDVIPDLPEKIDEILQHGAQKDPAERFKSANDLIAELDSLLGPATGEDKTVIRASAPSATVISAPRTEEPPAPVPAQRWTPNNLPVQLTTFVGRKQEIAEVRQLIDRSRHVSLIGTGGSGKTRLALEVAGQMLDDFPDGVWLVEFASLTNAALVPQRVAEVLQVREEPGRALPETLATALQDKTLLLLLDNCEHLHADCVRLIESLLKSCPHLRFLASTRTALRVAGETVYSVPSLSVPDLKTKTLAETELAAALIQYEAVRNCEAVQLFVDRAVASQPRFALTDQNAVPVAQICRRLDGIPLAIELAAARVRMLTVQQIAARLDDSIKLLTRGAEKLDPRQQTLRATMDWSYDLLAEKERLIFARLAVFAGGFDLEAAEAICAGETVAHDDVLDLLSELADKSLVTVNESEDEQSRYRLLETIRQYADEKLNAAPDHAAPRQRHRDFFTRLAEEGGAQLTGPAQATWLHRLEREHDNLRVVLDWSTHHDPTLGLRVGKALDEYWLRRGFWKEGRTWLEQCLAKSANVASALRAAALNTAGTLAARQGDDVNAERIFEEELALARQANDQPAIAAALHNLVEVAWRHGDYANARELEAQSLVIRKALGDKKGIAASLLSLATFAQEQGDFATAAPLHEESLALHRQLGEAGILATQLNNMGNMWRVQGQFDKARQFFEESLALRRKLGDRSGISMSLLNLAVLAQEQGDYTRAKPLLEESLLIDRELDNKQGIAYGLRNFAELMQRQGELEKALLFYQQSTRLFRDLDDKIGLETCFEGLAMHAALSRQPARAAWFFGAAESLSANLGSKPPTSFGAAEYAEQVATTQEFTTDWTAGHTASLIQAIERALEK